MCSALVRQALTSVSINVEVSCPLKALFYHELSGHGLVALAYLEYIDPGH